MDDLELENFLLWIASKYRGVLHSYTLPSGKKVLGTGMKSASELVAEYRECAS